MLPDEDYFQLGNATPGHTYQVDVSPDEWRKLGKTLQKKLSQLTPMFNNINFYFDEMIKCVESMHLDKYKAKKV